LSRALRGFNPLDREPPACRCGVAQAARAELHRNPRNPQCHLCRVIAVDHPDWTEDQVAEAGRAWWADAERRGRQQDHTGAPAAGATLAPAGRATSHAEDTSA
jgi:hypothetical protein